LCVYLGSGPFTMEWEWPGNIAHEYDY
jgi:hypothetical protein